MQQLVENYLLTPTKDEAQNAAMTYDQIVRHYKTFTQAAKAIGVSTATLNNWKRRGVPLETQVELEAQTEGKLKAKLPSYFRRQAA